MGVEKFEDMIAWQKAGELTMLIYKIFRNNKDFGFRDQIQRASVSIMNNIAEGFEKKGNKDFRRFLYIAKGSSGEVRSMAYLSLKLEYINKTNFNKIHNLSTEISKILSGFIKKLD